MNAIVDKAECSGAHARSSDKVVFASTLLVTLNVRKQLSAFVGSTSEFAFTSCCPSSKSRFQSYFVNRTMQKLRRCIRNPMLLVGLCLYVAPKTVRLCSGKLADRRSHSCGEPVGGGTPRCWFRSGTGISSYGCFRLHPAWFRNRCFWERPPIGLPWLLTRLVHSMDRRRLAPVRLLLWPTTYRFC